MRKPAGPAYANNVLIVFALVTVNIVQVQVIFLLRLVVAAAVVESSIWPEHFSKLCKKKENYEVFQRPIRFNIRYTTIELTVADP